MVHRNCSKDPLTEGATINSFSCSVTTYVTTGNSRQIKYDTSDICAACDTDGCNEAPKYAPMAVMIAIAVAAVKMLTF